jgi:hypothetical protein
MRATSLALLLAAGLIVSEGPAALAEESAAPGAETYPEPMAEAASEHPLPARLGTPASSLAAAPAWWERPPEALTGRIRVYAPETSEAVSLYAQAPGARVPQGELADGALACRLDLGDRGFDEQALDAQPESVLGEFAAVVGVAPDARRAPAQVVVAFGPEDSNRVTFLVPLVRLKVGACLSVRVVELDVHSQESVEQVRARYDGQLPLALAGRLARGDCRLVTRAALEARLAESLRQADEALEGAEADLAGVIDLGAHPPVSADGRLARPRAAVAAPAGLVGWDDPRVGRRMGRLEAMTARLEASLAHAFEAARPGAIGAAWAELAGGQLALRASSLRCGREALRPHHRLVGFWSLVPRDACVLSLGVKNLGPGPIAVGADSLGPLGELVLIDRRGTSRPLHLEGYLRRGRVRALPAGGLSLAPGAELELLAPPRPEEELLRAVALPVLVRGRLEGAPVYLDPGPPATSGERPPGTARSRAKSSAGTGRLNR